MRIMVTGGAGFIGSAVCRLLAADPGNFVLNVDALTYAGNRASLRAVEGQPNYAFMHCDIRDEETIHGALVSHGIDAIMHLAAESHIDRSIAAPEAFLESNIIGTWRLLCAARRYRDSLPADHRDRFRFHHVSTDEVYGDLPFDSGIFTEETAYDPSSPYSASKAASDHLVRAWGHTYGLPVLVSNCSNNYGPFQYPEKLIPLVILNALDGLPLPVYGAGKNIRDWLHVEDHARALEAIVRRGEVGRPIMSADVPSAPISTSCGRSAEFSIRNGRAMTVSPMPNRSSSSPTGPATTAATPSTRHASRTSSDGAPMRISRTASARP